MGHLLTFAPWLATAVSRAGLGHGAGQPAARSPWWAGWPQGQGPAGTMHAWPQPGVSWRGEAGAYALGIMAAGWVPEGSHPGCVTPSWPATALHLLVQHQATQLLVSSWWLGEPPELVLKPSLKEGVCELQLGGQCWQKLAPLWPASPKGSSECWLQAGGQHAPRPQRTEGLPRQAHQVPGSSIARECS